LTVTKKGYLFPIRFSSMVNLSFYLTSIFALSIKSVIVYYLFFVTLFFYLNNGNHLEVTLDSIALCYPHKTITIQKSEVVDIQIQSECFAFDGLGEKTAKTVEEVYITDKRGKILYFNSNYFTEDDYYEIRPFLYSLLTVSKYSQTRTV